MKLKKDIFVVALSGLAAALFLGVFLQTQPPSETQPKPVVGKTATPATPGVPGMTGLSAQAKSTALTQLPKASEPLYFHLARAPQFTMEPAKDADPKAGLPRQPATFSKSYLQLSSLPDLSRLRKGMKIGIPLSDGSSYDGIVNLVKPGKDGSVRVGGSLEGGNGGFALSKTAQGFNGMVRLPDSNRAFIIRSEDGRLVMKEHKLDEWQCLGMKPMQIAQAAAAAPPPTYVKPIIPVFDTKPAAAAVIYLDFDGEVITDSLWNDGNEIDARPPLYFGQPLPNSHIQTVVETVAQDFTAFNVSITTDEARYLAAPVGQRMRCIITITDAISQGQAAGVAFLNSWNLAGTTFDDDVPCWCFGMYNAVDMALVISHEIGHTFGLRHDGRGGSEYYAGHGGTGGVTGWGPIMGAPYGRQLTQWSNGDYNGATNTEDDVAIIASPLNLIGAVVDDVGNNVVQANQTAGATINGSFDASGFIHNSTDSDWYRFEHSLGASNQNGALNFSVAPVGTNTDLDLRLEIRDSLGALVVSSSPANSRTANVSGNLIAGTYYLVVQGAGEPVTLTNPPVTITAGFSNYGSLGAYRVTGFFTPVPSVPRIDAQPQGVAAVDGSTITLSVTAVGSGGLTYLWFKDGVAMSAETRSTLRLTNMNSAKAGSYRVRVTNSTNTSLTRLSDPAVVTVNFRPIIASQTPRGTVKLTAGQTANLSVTVAAGCTPPFTYTWQKVLRPANSTVRTATTNDFTDTFSINPIGFFDAGTYRVQVTNATGTVVTSANVIVNVDSPPVVITSPVNTVIESGRSGRLTVVAGGLARLNYQWYKVDRAPDPDVETPVGTNSPTLTIAGQPANAGDYFVRVSNSLTSTVGGGNAAQSADARVEVDTRPSIVTQPVGGNLQAGDAGVTLSVVAGGSATSRTFQWFKDGRAYTGPGSNTDTLTFAPTLAWQDRGAYFVEVRNRVGVVRSAVANLRVASKPIILVPPASVVGATNGSVRFTLTAGGDSPLRYQWFKDGTPATPVTAVVTSPILTLNRLGPANAGSYFCRVSNGHPGGSTDTNPLVTLVVEDAPRVTAMTTNFASNSHRAAVGADVTITPTVAGALPYNFQWLKAGRPFLGGTVDPLTGQLQLPAALTTDSGAYTVIVGNRTVDVNNRPITARSTTLNLSVLIPPTVTRPPRDLAVTEGQPVTMSVDAAGSPTLRYQWFKVEKDIADNDILVPVPGQTTNTLRITSPLANNSGRYRCQISNAVGTVTSPIGNLSVPPTPPPVITDFQPTKATKDDLILVTGSNLGFVASAKIGGKPAAVTLLNTNQIYLKVPAGLVKDTSYIMEVTSTGSGGSTNSSPRQLFYSDKPANDDVIDASILRGSVFGFQGNSTGFSASETIDTTHFLLSSAWHWWTVPATGRYTVRLSGQFNVALGRYAGTPGGVLTIQGAIVNSATNPTATESQNFNATGGQNIVFLAGGSLAPIGVFPTEGKYALIMEPANTMPTPGSMAVVKSALDWVGYRGDSLDAEPVSDVQDEDGQIRLGGDGRAAQLPAMIWSDKLSAPADSKKTIASVKMRLELPEAGCDDRFGWTAVDFGKSPMAAVWVDGRDGSLNYTSGSGVTTALNQRMISGSQASIEFLHDAAANELRVFYDGVLVHTDTTLKAGASFSTISATYQPAEGAQAHGSMIFSELNVRYE